MWLPHWLRSIRNSKRAEGSGKRADIVYTFDAWVGALLRWSSRPCPMLTSIAAYLTGGTNATIDDKPREIHLSNAQMASTLVALFDANRIYLSARSKEIGAMLQELEDSEIRISDDGHDKFGAFKVGTSDDLGCALA